MLTSKDCLARYGDPSHERNMNVWDVPADLEIGFIPKKVYCNKDLNGHLEQAFRNLIATGHVSELRDWAGCFNIRNKRGGSSYSLHAWGLAVDMNPTDNQFKWSREKLIAAGRKPFTDGFVKCFKDAGFDWGGDWKTPDCMHFQLARLP
jgi:D-alanyl-D-alanine carboxypeptidase